MATEQEFIEQLKKMQRRPSTPGDLLEDLMACNSLTTSDVAKRIGVSQQILNDLICEKRALTPDLAQRLGRLFGGGPGLWLKFQQQVDLWDALHMDQSQYEDIEPLPRAEAA